MRFTELAAKEFENLVQNPSLESRYSQIKESIATRESDGFQVVLLGIKDNNNRVIAASLFSKIPAMGSYVYHSNRDSVMGYSDLGLVDFYLREFDKYLHQHQCLCVKLGLYWLYQVYDKDINPLTGKNDVLVNLFKSHGYDHHGFMTQYDFSSQVRWMGVLNLGGKAPASLRKEFDSQRKRNINKAIDYGVEVRFLNKDEFDLFLDLYRETEARTGFASRTDDYFYNFIEHYSDKILVPLAYIDLNEYIQHLQESLSDKENRRDDMMAKENKADKQLKKIAELDKRIDHDKKELLQASELRQTDSEILNLASGVYFANACEVSYFFGRSSEKYNQYMEPYTMHWHMVSYCFDNGYGRYNFYGLSGDFTESSEDHGIYRFKRGFNVRIKELVGDFYKPINKVRY